MFSADIVFSIAILIMSVVAHEVAHGYAALALGDPTAKLAGRLTLNPIKHLDFWGSFVVPVITVLSGLPAFGWAKPVPFNPYNLRQGKWGPAIVGAAGPLTNFSLAIIFGILLRVLAHSSLDFSFAGALFSILSLVVLVNIVLGTFNLIPIPPLDGSKVLFALLPYQYNHIRIFLEQYGFFLILFFLLFFRGALFAPVSFFFRLITGIGL